MAPVLWVLAVLSTITVIHRIRLHLPDDQGPRPHPAHCSSAGTDTATGCRPGLHIIP